MLFLRFFLLLLTVASLSLYAGAPELVAKGSQLEKALQLVVEHKINAGDASKLTITVSLKGADFSEVNLVSAGTSVKVVPVASGDVMKMTFDLSKQDLESSRLIINKMPAARCSHIFVISIKEHTS